MICSFSKAMLVGQVRSSHSGNSLGRNPAIPSRNELPSQVHPDPTMWGPPNVISSLITPSNYGCYYHTPKREIVLKKQLKAIPNWAPHMVPIHPTAIASWWFEPLRQNMRKHLLWWWNSQLNKNMKSMFQSWPTSTPQFLWLPTETSHNVRPVETTTGRYSPFRLTHWNLKSWLFSTRAWAPLFFASEATY